MLLINIVYKEENVLEYIVLSKFFELFGISTYSTNLPLNNFINIEEVKKDFDKIVHLFLLGDDLYNKGDFPEEWFNNNIIIVSASNKERLGYINFPRKNNFEELKEMLTNIFNELHKFFSFGHDFDIEEMINIFIDCDLINNLYLLEENLKSFDSYNKSIIHLKNIYDKYLDKYRIVNNNYLNYAVNKIGYWVNSLCKEVGFKPLIKWGTLIQNMNELLSKNHSNKEYMFLLGTLFDEGNIDVMRAEKLYIDSLHILSSYSVFKLAILYDFKYNKPKYAKKILVQNIKYNEKYYQLLYKIGLLNDDFNIYEDAYEMYQKIYLILIEKLKLGYLTCLEGKYLFKVLGRMNGLNRFYRSLELEENNNRISVSIINSAKTNKYIRRLAEFIDIKEEILFRQISDNFNEYYLSFVKNNI